MLQFAGKQSPVVCTWPGGLGAPAPCPRAALWCERTSGVVTACGLAGVLGGSVQEAAVCLSHPRVGVQAGPVLGVGNAECRGRGPLGIGPVD